MAVEELQESRARYKWEGCATEKEGRPPNNSTETIVAVVGFLSAAIEYERPTLSGAAIALSMNLRTLQRRLAVDGVSFSELLDDYRHKRALDLLKSGEDFSVTDIAFKLGYADSAHFTRAFHRWSGSSPREFTRALLPSGVSVTEVLLGSRCQSATQ